MTMTTKSPTTYLKFTELPTRLGQVTKLWHVYSVQGGDWLGAVKWYPAWRRYTYQPAGPQVLDAACLTEIATFVGSATEQRKAERATEKVIEEAAQC